MKIHPPVRRCKAHHPRVPAFVPVRQRARSDGWAAERQARFLAELAITRSVVAAARKVGMARETAYRLRAKPGGESFAAAWDAVLGRDGRKRKVTAHERILRATGALIQPRIFRGQCTGIARKTDNSALLAHLAHLDRACRKADEESEWSQSFEAASACHAAPLPHRPTPPISLSRREYFASHRRGSQ